MVRGGGVESGIQICQTGNLSFCDRKNHSGCWLFFIDILIRYFHLTPFGGKSGSLIPEDHLCLALGSLGQLPVFETLSPVRWGQSSPCSNCHEDQMRSCLQNSWFRARHGGGSRYSSCHYVVPWAPGLLALLTFTGSGKTSKHRF